MLFHPERVENNAFARHPKYLQHRVTLTFDLLMTLDLRLTFDLLLTLDLLLTFDLVTPKLIVSCPCPVDHSCANLHRNQLTRF